MSAEERLRRRRQTRRRHHATNDSSAVEHRRRRNGGIRQFGSSAIRYDAESGRSRLPSRFHSTTTRSIIDDEPENDAADEHLLRELLELVWQIVRLNARNRLAVLRRVGDAALGGAKRRFRRWASDARDSLLAIVEEKRRRSGDDGEKETTPSDENAKLEELISASQVHIPYTRHDACIMMIVLR